MRADPEILQHRRYTISQASQALNANRLRRRLPLTHCTTRVGLLLLACSCAASSHSLSFFCGTLSALNGVVVEDKHAGGGITRTASAMRRAGVDPGDCKAVRSEAVSGVVLPPMEEDDPGWLSFMIARYLDDEWVELPVHEDIGAAVAKLYKASRDAGDNDVIAVLAKLSYGLKDMWKAGNFQEAFEGPIDIANRAAEFLMLRLGRKVWSYGRSNDHIQDMLMDRIEEYEARRRQMREA